MASAGGGGNEDYNRDLRDRFVVQHGDWRANNRSHKSGNLPQSQTERCTTLAADFFRANNPDIPISNVFPEDSHRFNCSWVNPSDNRYCFHVNFIADTEDYGTRFFFAEIIGNGPPQRVQSCVMIGVADTDWSTANCTFCSGMIHPTEHGGFDFGLEE